MEAFGLYSVAHSLGVNAKLGGDGADLSMLGVKVAANLHAGFGTDHENRPQILLGIRGKALMKRQLPLQMRQHNHTPGRFSGQRGSDVVTDWIGLCIPTRNHIGTMTSLLAARL